LHEAVQVIGGRIPAFYFIAAALEGRAGYLGPL
jgi:hypothetical protein